MEEGLSYLKEQFGLGETDVKTYSPLTLAYIGDAVYELVIRSILVGEGNMPVNKLHQRASQMVRASAQSAMIEKMQDYFTEEEQYVYKKGRNAKSHTMAKNATMADYRRATGFEAVMGYLYLTGQMKRLIDLVKIGLEEDKGNE